MTLDGSQSTDANGDPLTYSWSLLSKPANSGSIVLTNPGTVHPTFTVDRQAGDYIVQLVVNDGTVSSAPVTVTISTSNVAPIANAGSNQVVDGGTPVTLDIDSPVSDEVLRELRALSTIVDVRQVML